MKKIIGLMVILIAVIAIMATGTWAYFNDVVSTTGNTITAGTLTLSSAHNNASTPINIGGSPGIKPGDEADAGYFDLTTAGTINGDLYFKAANMVNHENTHSAVEIAAGDASAGATTGELGGLLNIAVWVDVAGGGTWAATDYYLDPTSGAKVAWVGSETTTYDGTHLIPDAAFGTANSVVAAFTGTTLATNLSAGHYGKVYVEYYFPDDTSTGHFTVNTDNQAQDDSITFDLDFALVQAGEP